MPQLDDIPGNVNVACFAHGSYTGNGEESQAIAGLGFQPVYVKIFTREPISGTAVNIFETTPEIMDDNASGGAIVEGSLDPEHRFIANAIVSLDQDGFTVDDNGNDSHPNKLNNQYNWIAFG